MALGLGLTVGGAAGAAVDLLGIISRPDADPAGNARGALEQLAVLRHGHAERARARCPAGDVPRVVGARAEAHGDAAAWREGNPIVDVGERILVVDARLKLGSFGSQLGGCGDRCTSGASRQDGRADEEIGVAVAVVISRQREVPPEILALGLGALPDLLAGLWRKRHHDAPHALVG